MFRVWEECPPVYLLRPKPWISFFFAQTTLQPSGLRRILFFRRTPLMHCDHCTSAFPTAQSSDPRALTHEGSNCTNGTPIITGARGSGESSNPPPTLRPRGGGDGRGADQVEGRAGDDGPLRRGPRCGTPPSSMPVSPVTRGVHNALVNGRLLRT